MENREEILRSTGFWGGLTQIWWALGGENREK